MKTVLITGVNGFVGKHLASELLENDYVVSGVCGPSGAKTVLGVDTYALDLADPEQLAELDITNIDTIIHLAGLAAVGPSFDNPMHYITTNAALEANLFQRAINQGVAPRFIIISSGSLYGSHEKLPISESNNVVPTSPYAVSKITQEQLGHYYGNRGFEVIVARPFNHIGPGQGTGFLVSDLASQVIACEQGQQDKIMVGNLDAKRDYTDVRDIVRAYRLLIETGRPGETYNICSGESHSGHEMLELILKDSQAKPAVEQDPAKMRPSDAPDIYGSHDKITEHTGWMPQINIDQTIHDVLEDWRAH